MKRDIGVNIMTFVEFKNIYNKLNNNEERVTLTLDKTSTITLTGDTYVK